MQSHTEKAINSGEWRVNKPSKSSPTVPGEAMFACESTIKVNPRFFPVIIVDVVILIISAKKKITYVQ